MLSPTKRPIVPLSIDVPEYGKPVEIAPGLLWLRIPLQIRLNHVNAFLFEDDDGWTILDTGVNDTHCRAAWDKVLANELSTKPVKRLIASHFHTDHVGLAGWLCERFGAEFIMTQAEYLLTRYFQADVDEGSLERNMVFLREHGVDDETALAVSRNRIKRAGRQTLVPKSFTRLRAGDTIHLGRRDWQVFTAGGHAVEQLMLYCAADKLFVAADVVLGDIVPMLNVGPLAPGDDPLGDFMAARPLIEAGVSDDVLVLPGHRHPFHGLHQRIDDLQQSYDARCNAIAAACRAQPMTALDLVPAMFGRTFSGEVMAATVGEVLAYINFLVKHGDLLAIRGSDGVMRYRHA